jgi:hypothetical protein
VELNNNRCKNFGEKRNFVFVIDKFFNTEFEQNSPNRPGASEESQGETDGIPETSSSYS